MPTQWMGTSEASAQLAVTQRTVNRYIARGLLNAARAYPHGPWLIPRAEVEMIQETVYATPGT